MTPSQWHRAVEAIKSEFGLSAGHRLADKISVVYLPAAPDTADQAAT